MTRALKTAGRDVYPTRHVDDFLPLPIRTKTPEWWNGEAETESEMEILAATKQAIDEGIHMFGEYLGVELDPIALLWDNVPAEITDILAEIDQMEPLTAEEIADAEDPLSVDEVAELIAAEVFKMEPRTAEEIADDMARVSGF